MTILFSTFGSLGDLHPYLALALEARARGHRPIIATSAKYRPKVEALGIEFRAVRPDLPSRDEFGDLARQVMDRKRGTQYLFKQLLGPGVRDGYFDLLEAGFDADLIVTHPAAPWGPLAASKLEKPWISSVLAPISLWSIHDPPTPPVLATLDSLRVLGPLWGRVWRELGKAVSRSWVAEIERFRAEQNLAPLGHPIFEGQFSPLGTLALFSRHFAPPQPDWPYNTCATGFCFYDAGGYSEAGAESKNPALEDASWRDWVRLDEKPVVWTLGSSATFDAGDFYERGAAICERLGHHGVLLSGGLETPRQRNEHVVELPYAPYSELFPHASVVVHQGGVGTTAQALRAGVTQAVMPYAHDQPDNARRVQQIGAGRWVARRDLERFIDREMIFSGDQTDAPNAQSIGAKIRSENGPRAACEFLEQVV